MYHEKFGQLVSSLKNLKARTPEVQIKELRRLAQAIARHGATLRPAYRRFFNMAENSLTSLADGFASGDATERDMQTAIDELDGWADAVEEMEKNPQGIKEKLPLDFLGELQKESDAAIKKYQAYKQMVPEKPTARITQIRVPVVAITDPFMFREKIAELKLGTDHIFGYPVLTNQIVVGLKNSWLTEEYRNNLGEALQDVLDIIKAKTGKSFVQLGEPSRRDGATWVWLVNDLMLQKLNKASAGGHFKLKSWAFPFEAKKFSPTDPNIKRKLAEKIYDPKLNPKT